MIISTLFCSGLKKNQLVQQSRDATVVIAGRMLFHLPNRIR